MPQLDSVRALAVAAVMLWHFDPGAISSVVPLGLSVELFFVLSGFLITGILLHGEPSAEFVVGFYVRRALRLFPLYYLVIAIVAIASQEIRDAWTYYALYGANLWVVEKQRWGIATHFWSLAVEEQFYLIWPFVVLWCSRRALTAICFALIVAGATFRLAAVLFAQNYFAYVLLPGSFDALACGALLALFGPSRPSVMHAVMATLSALAVIVCWQYGNPASIAVAIHSVGLPFFYVVISGTPVGFDGVLGRVLAQPVLRYLGRISYGLYVFHYLVFVTLKPYLLHVTNDPIAQVGIYTFATLVLGIGSWHFIESPINRNRDFVVGVVAERLSRFRFQNSD